MLWVLVTLIAAAAQTARNAMQSRLTAEVGTLGATQVRFVYGLPFALVLLALVVWATGVAPPAANAAFFGFVALGGVAQILGTAALLAAMRARSFSVGLAFSKTEAVQVAAFGLVVLGDALTPVKGAAIVVATLGVMLMAVKPGERFSLQPALIGAASGGFYAIAAVGFRGAILALDGPFLVSAATTLVASLALQSALLGAWLLAFDRAAWVKSFVLWRSSLFAGSMGALASQFWFIGFALTSAANVRTLGLVEVLFAMIVQRRVFAQRITTREVVGVALIVAGVAALLAG